MATIEEGFCRDDTGCSQEQYCYDVSKRCVDYTQCSRYNRRESERRSRQPSQCGPCLPGHTAETLGTGEMAVLCKKTNMQENVPEVHRKLNNNVVIYTIFGVSLICFLVILLIAIFLKIRSRRAPKRRDDDLGQCSDLCVVTPSAPQAESSPFIGYAEKLPYVPFNNNKNLKDKNTLVCATGYMAPDWVRSNPNYEDNVDNDNVGAFEQLHSRAESPPATDNSNMFPEQLALVVVPGNRYEEDIDNTANSVLVQRNNLSPSNITEENNNDEGDDDENINNNNSNNNRPSSENNAQGSRERVRASNILITQKISMNVNVLNGDC